MNANATFLKTGAEASALLAKEMHASTGKPSPAQILEEQTLALDLWQWASTTLSATYVSPTGAAILAKNIFPGWEEGSYLPDSSLPYVKGWKKILKEIEWNRHGFVRQFLRDVIFWHHQSTNGRFNDKLGRFERWGVRPVAEWLAHTYKAPNPGYKPKKEGGNPSWETGPKTVDSASVSRAEFFRIKDRLLAMGLIEAESHLWNDPYHALKNQTWPG